MGNFICFLLEAIILSHQSNKKNKKNRTKQRKEMKISNTHNTCSILEVFYKYDVKYTLKFKSYRNNELYKSRFQFYT